jgi:ubiquinone/menaquinone biosynthesis C-methylase UbiE
MTKDSSVQEFWDRVAADWDIQVGDDGDSNRRLNSDPCLWRLAGDVRGLTVLDAGCGTGYLSAKLREKGAIVTGIDFSLAMIEIARRKRPGVTFHVDSCSKLETQPPGHFDLIIANYVLMDVEDLRGCVRAFHRVLKPGGIAVVIFSHPCFPQGKSTDADGIGVSYEWNYNYFEESRRVDPPWGHFTSEFIWFHRPLSTYWSEFTLAGFEVLDLDEPKLEEERFHLAANEKQLHKSRSRPYSIAFRLKKTSGP